MIVCADEASVSVTIHQTSWIAGLTLSLSTSLSMNALPTTRRTTSTINPTSRNANAIARSVSPPPACQVDHEYRRGGGGAQTK